MAEAEYEGLRIARRPELSEIEHVGNNLNVRVTRDHDDLSPGSLDHMRRSGREAETNRPALSTPDKLTNDEADPCVPYAPFWDIFIFVVVVGEILERGLPGGWCGSHAHHRLIQTLEE